MNENSGVKSYNNKTCFFPPYSFVSSKNGRFENKKKGNLYFQKKFEFLKPEQLVPAPPLFYMPLLLPE